MGRHIKNGISYGGTVNDANMVKYKNGTVAQKLDDMSEIITGTLASGDTTIELTSDRITADSVIDPYFYVEDGAEIEPISYSTIKVENGKVTMTFDALESNLQVGIRVI